MILSLLAGLASGLRSLTPTAAVAWAAHLGSLDLSHSPLAFLASGLSVGILTVLAFGELVFDKLPSTPNRTAALGLSGRLVMGGLSGAALAVATGAALALGAALGAVGGLVGAFGGYQARSRAVRAYRAPLVIALVEDAITIGMSVAVIALA